MRSNPRGRADARRFAGRARRGSPARTVVSGFGVALAVGTVLLMLPISSETGDSTDLLTAMFTATSAVCVTGLVVVDTSGHWSTFGEVVVLGLIQVGGLGIMTLASLFGLMVSRSLGLRMQLTAQAETKSIGLHDVRSLVARIIQVSLLVEFATALVLFGRYVFGHDEPVGEAAYLAVFHAVSAFNNAGFALYPDSIIGFATDPWICIPIMIAVVIGGMGFPVWFELWRRIRHETERPRRWSLHLKVTVLTYGALLVLGWIVVTAIEWSNPATLGQHSAPGRVLVGLFHGVMPRTAGFNSLDVAEMRPATLLVNNVLMFIGGGSAGTAGGIKVTTFALLGFVIWAEIRGEPTVHVMGRRLGAAVQRQALTIALLSVGAVVLGTIFLQIVTPFSLDDILFEVTSAFGTVGMSTGITASIPPSGQVVLIVLMFLGRLGPITLATALALRERTRRYELPEERPIVG